MSDPAFVPPHDLVAEQAVIASVLKQPLCIAQASHLRPEDFHDRRNKAIWRAALDLWERNVPLDYATLAHRLDSTDLREFKVGVAELAEIDLAHSSAAHIEHYAKIVIDLATLRRYISTAQSISDAASRPGADKDIEAVIAKIDSLVAAAKPSRSRRDLYDPDGWGQEFWDDIAARQEGRRVAVTTGLLELDDMTLGLEAGRLYLLMATSGTGKSELAMQVAMHVAERHGPVLVASLEMTAVELAQRYARIKHGLNRNRLATANLSEEEFELVAKTIHEMRTGRLWPSTPSGPYTTADLRADALDVQARHGHLALIVADYVQRFRDKAGNNSIREQDVGMVAENLKSLAREFGCAVLAPVQPNREYVKRPSNPRPVLSDLRESGRLEQEADVVLGLYRDEKHHADTDKRGIAEVIMLKNRSGVGDADGAREIVWRGHKYDNLEFRRDDVPWAA